MTIAGGRLPHMSPPLWTAAEPANFPGEIELAFKNKARSGTGFCISLRNVPGLVSTTRHSARRAARELVFIHLRISLDMASRPISHCSTSTILLSTQTAYRLRFDVFIREDGLNGNKETGIRLGYRERTPQPETNGLSAGVRLYSVVLITRI